jgi:hypothetical protein
LIRTIVDTALVSKKVIHFDKVLAVGAEYEPFGFRPEDQDRGFISNGSH